MMIIIHSLFSLLLSVLFYFLLVLFALFILLRYFVSSLVVDYTFSSSFPARLIIAGLGPVRPSVCLAFSRGKKKK